MTNTKTGAGAVFDFVQTDALKTRLVALAKKHEEQGRISHGLGVRSAIEVLRKEAAAQKKLASKSTSPA